MSETDLITNNVDSVSYIAFTYLITSFYQVYDEHFTRQNVHELYHILNYNELTNILWYTFVNLSKQYKP